MKRDTTTAVVQIWEHKTKTRRGHYAAEVTAARVQSGLDATRWVGLKVTIPQCSSAPPPLVPIGEQETHSGLKLRWHLAPNLSCLNYPGADKG